MSRTLTTHSTLHSFRFDTATPSHHFLFTMDVKSLYIIPNDCGLQALAYFLDTRDIKEPSTSTLTRLAELVLTLNSFSFSNETSTIVNWVELQWEVEWVETMPAYSSDMWNNKSASSTQDSYHSFTRGTSTTFLGQLHVREMSSKTLLTLFLTSTQHFNSHQKPKRTYHFSILPCAFLKIEFKPLSSTWKWILTTTSIALLFILITTRVLFLTANSSAFVDAAQTMITQRGYPLTSLDQDLNRVTTIGRPDALTGSERRDTTDDRLPLVMTYHPFNPSRLHQMISTSELSDFIHRPENARHLFKATYCSI